MSTESMQVLKMLSEGKISVEDANRLLMALDGDTASGTATAHERRVERQDPFFMQLTPKQLSELRMHNVTPEYVRAMRSIGYPNISVSHLIALRTHGVEPSYVQALREAGYLDLVPEHLIQLRIHGIDHSLVMVFQSAGTA